jgi:hypothetical protein
MTEESNGSEAAVRDRPQRGSNSGTQTTGPVPKAPPGPRTPPPNMALRQVGLPGVLKQS